MTTPWTAMNIDLPRTITDSIFDAARANGYQLERYNLGNGDVLCVEMRRRDGVTTYYAYAGAEVGPTTDAAAIEAFAARLVRDRAAPRA